MVYNIFRKKKKKKGDFLQSEITIILRILLWYQSYLFHKSLVAIQELLKSGLLMRMNFLTGQNPLHNQYPYNLENVNLMEVGAPTIRSLLYTWHAKASIVSNIHTMECVHLKGSRNFIYEFFTIQHNTAYIICRIKAQYNRNVKFITNLMKILWKRCHTLLQVCILTSTAKMPQIIQIFISRLGIKRNNLTAS